MGTSDGSGATRAGEQDEVVRRLEDPGFTPGVRSLAGLLDLMSAEDERVARRASKAVLRIEAQHDERVAGEVVARARAAVRPARARLTELAGRLAHERRDPSGAARTWLLEALRDADVKTRRVSARALGNLEPTPEIEAALAAAFDAEGGAGGSGALAMALGKVGGREAEERLAASGGRAPLIASRQRARGEGDGEGIDPDRAHPGPLPIRFHTRSGLEPVLIEELGAAFGAPRLVAPGVVEAVLRGPLAEALAIRTASHVGLPLEPRPKSGDLASDVVAVLASPRALATLRAFDASEPVRFRLDLGGGHRRGVLWRVAELVRTRVPALVNDPRSSPWSIAVDDAGPDVKVELVPRGAPDARFSYRQAFVAASSHPTIAAALARIAPRRDDDVVWDPFVGAGAELAERARLGPWSRLVGTDLDPKAVDAARANLERAGVDAARTELAIGSALDASPAGVTLVVTNPPMGRRVQRGTHADLLERFVAHAARVLVPGGALVWIVPEPQRIRARAAKEGLELVRAFTVDMGGFPAELEVFVKRARERARLSARRR